MTVEGAKRGSGTVGDAVQIGLSIVATAPAALIFQDFFATEGYLYSAVAALAGVAVLTFVAAKRRWQAVRIVYAGVGGFVVLAAIAVSIHGAQIGQPWTTTALEAVRGLATGWARMLSIGLPADLDTRMLVTVLLLVWTAAFVAVLLALRTASPLAPAFPSLLAFTAGLVMVASAGHTHSWLAVVLAFATGALALVRARRQAATVRARAEGDRLAARRRMPAAVLLGVPAIAAVALASTGAIQFGLPAAGDRRADPRPLHPYGLRHPDLLSPLSMVRSQLDEKPARTVLVVQTPDEAAAPVELIRTAALDTFDGALWTAHDNHLLAGRRLPANERSDAGPRQALTIGIRSLDGPYLPVAGWPLQVELAGPRQIQIGYSATSGTVVADTADGRLDGITYTIIGAGVTAGDVDSTAAPSRSAAFARYVQLPEDGLRPQIRGLAHQLTDVEPTTPGKLSALEAYLRSLPYDLSAPPGHSYAAIGRMLGAPANVRDAHGYAEQHASAFVVLARLLNMPARVAVGYRLPSTGAIRTVTTREAHAWAEVHLDGYGWVAYDPTDPERKSKSAIAEPTVVPTPSNAGAAQPEATPSIVPSPPPPKRPEPPPGFSSLLAIALGITGAATGLIIGVPMVKVVRRRHRRRAPTAPARVVGAWCETVDRLVERRLAVPGSMTATEIAMRAEAKLGARACALPELATLATRATFGPGHLAPDAALRAWRLEREFRRGLVRGWAAPRRLHVWFSPRPLIVAVKTRRRRNARRQYRRRP
ncbi:transglutaminase family protein [Phytohabitans aurantiacus]|uniref:Transglutaminase-like domain-containing protein n=1 Tax=Phytohabitans aurantiacus TaxID=3016789 RepID=A0ABQ5R3D5_9ACTN|nr:transglutaminase domain-containing protein [Phytohabitans aurantiacus]GLI01046.1 hypothetical protein Pa4123_63220 [Phytohabitans aurantiacus]